MNSGDDLGDAGSGLFLRAHGLKGNLQNQGNVKDKISGAVVTP